MPIGGPPEVAVTSSEYWTSAKLVSFRVFIRARENRLIGSRFLDVPPFSIAVFHEPPRYTEIGSQAPICEASFYICAAGRENPENV
jgi:hypothetical protein